MNRACSVLRIVVLTFLPAAIPCRAEGFALKDGDTVAFLGDSITAARGYTKIVEHYTLMRFPQRKVRFFNAGQGGDTAAGAVQRLERDVFSKGATVVTVAFGVNDIGWGARATPENKQKYLDGIRAIVTKCQEKGVRPFICSPAITSVPPDEAEQGFLQTMTDEGLALAKSLGAGTIDLQRGMREIQCRVISVNAHQPETKHHVSLHVADGVHLSDLGQLAMGYSLLKGLGAPAEVSGVSIDATNIRLLSATGCAVTGLEAGGNGGITFTRLDEGLPLNLGVFGVLNHRFVPIPDGLNQYRMTISGLPAGKYEILAAGRKVGEEDAGSLARGINLASMTANPWEPGGPWNAQSDSVKELVDARDYLWAGARVSDQFLEKSPNAAAATKAQAETDTRITDLMRLTAKPWPYHMEVRPLPQEKPEDATTPN